MNETIVDIAYSVEYLEWILGPKHPTDPTRAAIAVDLLTRTLPERGIEVRVVQPVASDRELLRRTHTADYVDDTMRGHNSEWSAWGRPRPDLGRTAAIMCGGTEALARRILAGETRVGFNPQGAKHHAHRDHGSGFCVFNDVAVATDLFTEAGWRVAYLDFDAHHGDGVEALLRQQPTALTASIHQSPLFPGTGLRSCPAEGAHNWPLPPGTGDAQWLEAIQQAADLIQAWSPDVLITAIGADAHETDPLSDLRITAAGYQKAGRIVGKLVASLDVPVLIGGAGGYQSTTWTPKLWAGCVTEVAIAQTEQSQRDVLESETRSPKPRHTPQQAEPERIGYEPTD